MMSICKKWDIELAEFCGEVDHVYLLTKSHPSAKPSKFVNNLKTVSSRMVRKEYGAHLEKFYWKPVLRTGAYCLLSVGGAPNETIREYIENQQAPKH